MGNVYFILEHPRLGVFTGDYTETGRPSYSWTTYRSDERVARYATIERAKVIRSAFPESYREVTNIMRSPAQRGDDWKVAG